jgi:membrane protease YdiL (CAAX protease family)
MPIFDLRKQRVNPAYPRFSQIARVALPAFFLAQFLVWPIMGLSLPRLGLIAAELVIVWFMALFIRRHRLRAEDLLLLNATPLPTLLLTLPIAVCASLVIAEFDLFWGQALERVDLGMPLSFQRTQLEIQLVRDLPDALLALAAVVLMPGLCEELFFRGFAFTGLYAHHGPRIALWASALIFAAAHFNPWQLPALFLFGLFLGLLVFWTHSIYPAILAHAANNALSAAGVNLRTYYGLESLGPSQHLPMPLALVALLLLLFGLLLLRRQPTIMPLPPPPRPDSNTIRPLPGLSSPS